MRLQRRQTAVVMAVLVLVALVWEGLTLAFGQQATISELVWGIRSPLLPFVAGVLVGHFWFPKGACVHCGKYPYRKDAP